MDNKNNNNSVNNTTNSELELKIRREKINGKKTETTNVKTPRRYNPINANINENEKINDNQSKINPDAIEQLDNPNFENNFQNIDNNEIDNENDIIDVPQDDETSKIEQVDNNQEVKKTSQGASDGDSQSVPTTPNNNISQRKNEIANNNRTRNISNDPTQRKLDRFNNQKKQAENNKDDDNLNKSTPQSDDPNRPETNTPKTKGSAPTSNEKSDNSASKVGEGLNKINQLKNGGGDALEKGINQKQDVKEKVKEEVKEQIKKKVRTKILAFISNVILPALPYIGIVLLIIFLLLLLIFGIFGYLDDEENVSNTIKINYCEHVNLKWGVGEEQNVTISANDYIKYMVNNSEFKIINDQKALMALVIVYRTNLYANSNNLDGNTCYFEVDKEYQVIDNDVLDDAIEETDNKVFSVSKTVLSEIQIDKHFTYKEITDGKYRLYQDKWTYNKDWIDANVGSKNISNNTKDVSTYSFSPFGAWYLAVNNDFDALSLIFHFVTPGSHKGNIYRVQKISSGGYENGEYDGSCSDISLTTTSLDRKDFIDRVNSYGGSSSFSIFKTNAGKIYDISIKNNFNPEMVVIRAISEGFSPGGSTNNYWGIGCSNNGGGKDCSTFHSFDEGVLGYINTVKRINSVSLFAMQRKYAYIGSNWFNPGGSGVGGCYYFPYIKKYMSEERANEVAGACASGATCTGSACLKTTDEDQDAYTRYQIESMLQLRANVFNITADECSEQEGATEDVPASELGKAVVQYAIKTYDSWRYSQENRHQNGFVDCSSLVSRAYLHFNFKVFDSSDTSGEIYRWCENNGKTISGNSLAPGDLIFYNSGSHSNSDHHKGIGHVEMYVGNNQKFGAHSAYTGTGNNRRPRAVADQVSVTSYNGNGNLFCRPASA